MRESVFGNPHSVNPTSSAATVLVERARAAVLRYFNASESEYACIFTANATGALRLVGEAYPFTSEGRFLALFDNHNSVNGIREFARAKGAETAYVPLEAPDLRVADAVLEQYLDDAGPAGHNLFAYPAQSNFSGVKHPLEWIATAQERGWDVIVDCAAFVPTSPLDLSVWKPDFVPISFYKMFGYPTGIGALLARREALERLHRPWFSGGTVDRRERPGRHGRAALGPRPVRGRHGQLPRHPGDRDRPAAHRAHRHRHDLAAGARHSARGCSRRCCGCGTRTAARPRACTGRRRGTVAGARSRSTSCTRTAASSTSATSTSIAAAHGISVRTGCFCNSGAGETAFSISSDTLIGAEFGEGMILDDYIRLIGMPTGGAVRVSLGLATNFADVYRFMTFATEFRDVTEVPADLPPRIAC